MRKFPHLLILLIIFIPPTIITPTTAETLPIIDGAVDSAWDAGFEYKVSMTNGAILNLTILYTSSDIYFLVVLPHNSADDEIIQDTTIKHDYFGIEFDRNGDNVIMGVESSPDDMMIIDYDKPGLIDMYMHSYKAFEDIDNQGVDNGEGQSGTNDGNLIYEFRKPLNSGDINGYDIELKDGDQFQIMLAFWDDKNPHTAAEFTNVYKDGSQFMKFTVGNAVNSNTDGDLSSNVIAGIVVLISVVLTLLLSKFKPKKK